MHRNGIDMTKDGVMTARQTASSSSERLTSCRQVPYNLCRICVRQPCILTQSQAMPLP